MPLVMILELIFAVLRALMSVFGSIYGVPGLSAETKTSLKKAFDALEEAYSHIEEAKHSAGVVPEAPRF